MTVMDEMLAAARAARKLRVERLAAYDGKSATIWVNGVQIGHPIPADDTAIEFFVRRACERIDAIHGGNHTL